MDTKRVAMALAALSLAAPLSACMTATARPEPPPKPPDAFVGTTRWVSPKFPLSICDEPRDYTKGLQPCRIAKAGEPLAIVAKYSVGRIDAYEVKDAAGKTGYLTTTDPITMDTEEDRKQRASEKAECDRRGGVAVGMTRAQVYASCWGKPRKINTTMTAGAQHEQLVYGSGNYVYLQNGVVRSLQTSN